jgi:hypothetical protein
MVGRASSGHFPEDPQTRSRRDRWIQAEVF